MLHQQYFLPYCDFFLYVTILLLSRVPKKIPDTDVEIFGRRHHYLQDFITLLLLVSTLEYMDH